MMRRGLKRASVIGTKVLPKEPVPPVTNIDFPCSKSLTSVCLRVSTSIREKLAEIFNGALQTRLQLHLRSPVATPPPPQRDSGLTLPRIVRRQRLHDQLAARAGDLDDPLRELQDG